MSLRQSLVDDLVTRTRTSFDRHVITDRGVRGNHGWWVIRQPYPDGRGHTSNLWCEVIEGFGGYLYVNGDIDAAVFGYSDSQVPGGMVRWMARQTPSDPYMAEKMRIGMGYSNTFDPAVRWDRSVACEEVGAHLDELTAEGGDRRLCRRLQELLANMASGDVDQYDVGRRLYQFGMDPDTFSRWGLVPSQRIVMAWGALCRLRDLINSEVFSG